MNVVMAMYSDYVYPLKIFVKENDLDETKTEAPKKRYLPVKPLTGESAKTFYESVIQETPTSKPKNSLPKRLKSCKRPPKSTDHANGMRFKIRDLHKMAQNNEADALSRILRYNKEVPVDATDDFGWTPLMCAACSGAREAVEILLLHKANPYLCDKFGNSAVTLGRKKNLNIKQILEKCNAGVSACNDRKEEFVEPFFCQTCNDEFHTNIETHEASTLHLFNSQPKHSKTFYGIPDCNRGFQLLLKNGWNREKGLGAKECGMKYPVKAVKKNDRVGIGGSFLKNEMSMKDINCTVKHQMKKKIIMSHEQRLKNFERDFRLEFL